MVSMLPGGLLADRGDRRLLMRVVSGSGAILYGWLVVTALAGVLTMGQLVAVAFLTGVGSGLFAPVEMSALRTIVAEEDMPVALSQNEARSHAATLAGGPLGGVLYAVTRWLPFLVDAVSYAVAWLMLGRIRADLAATPRTEKRRPRHDAAEGLRFVWHHPFYRAMLLYTPAANLVVSALFAAAVLRLVESHTAPWAIGMVDLSAGLSGLLGAAVAPRIVTRVATGPLTAAAAWSFVPLLIPMIFWNSPAIVALALAAGLFLNPAGKAGIGSYRLTITPRELVGRVQATGRFVSWSTLPLAPILGGALLSAIGGPAAMATLAVLAACVALIPTLNRSIRDVPRPAQWPATGLATQPDAATT